MIEKTRVKIGRMYPSWMWWVLDKIAWIFNARAIRGDGWSCLYYAEQK